MMFVCSVFLLTILSRVVELTGSSCLTFTLNPSRVVEDQSVELKCHINNLPKNPPYYQKRWVHHFQGNGLIGASPLYTLLRDGATHTDTVGKYHTGRVVKVNDDVIRLNNVTQQDVGLYYSCYLDSDLSGCISARASANMTVIVPVSNVKLSVTSVKQGERATFRCTADGDTPITYTWQKVAGSLPGGGRWQDSSDGSVTLSNVQKSDAGSYMCTADNEANKPVTSDQVYFDVYYAPSQFVLTSSPSDLTHRDTDNAQVALTCSAASGHPAPDVILYRGTIRVTSGTSQITHRRRLQKSDNQVAFVCNATSKGISGEMSSNQIIYNITFLPEGVRMIPNPGGAVNINTDITLRCSITTSSNPPVTLEWLINNSNPLGNVSTSQTNGDHNGKVAVSEMKLKARRQNNGAVVTCRVKSLPRITDSYNINTLFPPTRVTTTESPPGAVRTGSSKQLTCTTDSANPSALITWMRNGVTESDRVQLTNPDGDYKAKKTSSTITIATTRNHNNNQYSCVIKHQNTEITALKRTFKLNVTYPHTVTVQIKSTPVTEGGHVTLTCDAAGGNPQNILSYEWRRTSVFTPNRGKLAAAKQITFQKVTYKDAGKYECHVTNAGGTSSDENSLTVLYTPKLDPRADNHKSVVYTDIGEVVTFNLKVIANPKPIFTWKYKHPGENKSLLPEFTATSVSLHSQLTIHNVSVEDFTTYTCMVMNSVGTNSFHFEIKPAAAPDTPANYQLVYTSVTTVTLSWISSFSGGYPQTFHIMYRKIDGSRPVKPQIQNITDPGEGSEVTYKLSGLHPGTSYEFRVKAVNSRSTGPNSSDFTSAVKTTTKESPYIDERALTVSRHAVSSVYTVSWTEPRGSYTDIKIRICEDRTLIPGCRFHESIVSRSKTKTEISDLEADRMYVFNLLLYDKDDLVYMSQTVTTRKDLLVEGGHSGISDGLFGAVVALLIVVIVILVGVIIYSQNGKSGNCTKKLRNLLTKPRHTTDHMTSAETQAIYQNSEVFVVSNNAVSMTTAESDPPNEYERIHPSSLALVDTHADYQNTPVRTHAQGTNRDHTYQTVNSSSENEATTSRDQTQPRGSTLYEEINMVSR